MHYTIMRALLSSTLLSSPAWAAINAADYGLSQSGDNTDALQRAFDTARGSGQEVVIPAGTYSYSRQLTVDGVRVRGSSGTVLAPSDPYNQRITLTGNSPALSDVYIRYHPVARSGSDHGRNGVWVQNANNFTVSGVTFDGAAYGVPPQGQGAGDLFVYNSTDGTITNNSLSYTWADAIHITGSSNDIDVLNNRIDHSGDDGIAVVNYGGGAGDVGISGNTVTDNLWGRGITAVGASDVQITNNLISGNATDGAGVYVASEPAYNTPAPRNVLVQGNTVQDTGGPGKGHGQIMLWSGNGPLSNVTVRDNEVRNSARDDLAVVVSGPMNGVTIDGNNIDGQITTRNGARYSDGGNTTNDASMANSVTVPAGTSGSSGGGGSGGGGSGGGGTGTDSAQYYPAQASFAPPTSGCASSEALSTAMAAAGAIASIWSGGRATAPLQIAQQIQLVAQRICLQEQLLTMLRNLQATPLNTAGDIQAAMALLRSLLGTSDATIYNLGQATGIYQNQYPDSMTGMPMNELLGQTEMWRSAAHRANEESWRIQSGVVQGQAATQARVGQQLDAVQTAPGMLAAQQGTAQLLGSLIGETQAMQNVTISHYRSVEHSIAQQQAKAERAEELHRRAMQGLGENDTVSVRSPF